MFEINKRVLELAASWIIFGYKGKITLTQAFVVVERCNQAFYQYDAIYVISWMTDSTKSRRVVIATNNFIEIELEMTKRFYIVGNMENMTF